jgi:hypothetical protein
MSSGKIVIGAGLLEHDLRAKRVAFVRLKGKPLFHHRPEGMFLRIALWRDELQVLRLDARTQKAGAIR